MPRLRRGMERGEWREGRVCQVCAGAEPNTVKSGGDVGLSGKMRKK